MKNKGFCAILAFLALKKLTRIFLGNLYREDLVGFFFTTSTRFIEHKKVGIVHVAICLRLNAKITGQYLSYPIKLYILLC